MCHSRWFTMFSRIKLLKKKSIWYLKKGMSLWFISELHNCFWKKNYNYKILMEPEYKGYYIYTQDGTCNLFCIFEKIYSDKIKSKLGLNQMDRARFVKWIKDKKNSNCVQRDMKLWLSREVSGVSNPKGRDLYF